MMMATKSDNEMSMDLAIGNRLRARRLELGLSQERLGAELGLTFQQVQKYEKGTNRIASSRLVVLAKVLKVEPDYFLDGLDGGGKGRKQSQHIQFLATKEGTAIVEGMLKLKQREQHAVIDLVRGLIS